MRTVQVFYFSGNKKVFTWGLWVNLSFCTFLWCDYGTFAHCDVDAKTICCAALVHNFICCCILTNSVICVAFSLALVLCLFEPPWTFMLSTIQSCIYGIYCTHTEAVCLLLSWMYLTVTVSNINVKVTYFYMTQCCHFTRLMKAAMLCLPYFTKGYIVSWHMRKHGFLYF